MKDVKFYLESKALFIDISSIASFKLFWLLGCRNIALFRTVLWLAWSPRLGQNTPSWELFSEKNLVLLSNFFSSSNMFFRLFLVNHRGSSCSFKRKGEFISPSSLVWGKSIAFCTCTRSCVRAHVRALMTRKSCAVGMRNAILRNYLKCQLCFSSLLLSLLHVFSLHNLFASMWLTCDLW